MPELKVAKSSRAYFPIDLAHLPAVPVQGVVIFLVALIVYVASAVVFSSLATPDTAYFNELAAAFLHGRLYIVPKTTDDLTMFAGRWYVAFPPLPAILMLPLVLVFGTAAISSVLFNAIFGAANVLIVFFIIVGLKRRGWVSLDGKSILWLTALFGFSTVNWSMAATGSVWFLGQVCAFTFVALAVLFAIWLPRPAAPWLAGLALGLAVLGRPNVVFTWPLILGVLLSRYQAPVPSSGPTLSSAIPTGLPRKSMIRLALYSLLPVGAAIFLLIWYNQARFGNPLDFGYKSMDVSPALKATLMKYGQFNVVYLPQNLWAMLLAGPAWDGQLGHIRPNIYGMSMLLTTPAIVFLWLARGKSTLVRGSWIALALLLVPLMFYYNTGFAQFGYRFSLDFLMPVVVLIAIAVQHRTTLLFRLLVLAGVCVNTLGTIWWLRIQ